MSSRSFMDAIRGVVLTEGAKDKTSDGMTKDAKHFAQDLHKVQDAGVKHMVQKDSETKDYERMFSGGVEKAPTRLADVEPSQSVDKYVEYNEAVQMKAKKNKEEKPGDLSNSEDATGPMESYVGESGGVAAGYYLNANKKAPTNVGDPSKNVKGSFVKGSYATSRDSSSQPNFIQRTFGSQSASKISPSGMSGSMTPSNQGAMAAQTKATAATAGARKPAKPASSTPSTNPGISKLNAAKPAPKTNPGISKLNSAKPSAPAQAAGPNRGIAQINKPGSTPSTQTSGPNRGLAQNKPAINPSTQAAGPNRGLAQNKPAAGAPPKPTAKPQTAKPQAAKPQAAKPQTAKPQAAKPQVAKPQAAKPKLNALQQQQRRSKSGRDAVAGPSGLNQSYEIEWNGNSYMMNEAQINALSAFIEKYGVLDEVITKSTPSGEVVKDFVHSDNPKFAGKSKRDRIRMALGAAYDRKRGK